MVHLTRRQLLAGAGAAAATLSLSGYATAYETGSALTLAKYTPRIPNWPEDLELTIAVIADIHACYPWMSEERVGDIVDLANAQKPDLTVLLGVYEFRFLRSGNHDWLSAAIPTEPPDNSRSVRRALAEAGVPLLENQSVRLSQRGRPFWLIGLGDLLAPVPNPRRGHGADDLPAAMRAIDDDAPAILLVHEPYFFPWVPERIALTLAGHTHGGQVNLPIIGAPVNLLKRRSSKYIYGEYALSERRMIVSGGLGTSVAPVRILRPPEVVMVKLGGDGGLA